MFNLVNVLVPVWSKKPILVWENIFKSPLELCIFEKLPVRRISNSPLLPKVACALVANSNALSDLSNTILPDAPVKVTSSENVERPTTLKLPPTVRSPLASIGAGRITISSLNVTPIPGILNFVIFASPRVISLLVLLVDASAWYPIIILLLPATNASPACWPIATFL